MAALNQSTIHYSDLAVKPQLVRNVPLLTFFLSADPRALARVVPAGLSMHRSARIVLNMWFLPDAQELTGFGSPGPLGITYLAAEVAGEESESADRTMRFPARFWLEHWSSSPAAREYARSASGLEIADGDTRLGFRGDLVETSLHLGERTVITARARVGRDRLNTSSGHSIYYAERASPVGGREIARFDVPWVSDAYGAEDPVVECDFAHNEPALGFIANGRQVVTAVTFRRITLVPYLASGAVKLESPP